MRTKPPAKLQKLFNQAREFQKAGEVVTTEFLCSQLGVTVYGAACLLFMLAGDEYSPCLQAIYRQGELSELIGKEERNYRVIIFREDMPPFKKMSAVTHELSEKDKEVYVSLGIADDIGFEGYRRFNIALYWGMCKFLEQMRVSVKAALVRNDAAYFKDFFCKKSDEEISKLLKRNKLKDHEIRRAIELGRIENRQ